jgi:hypothetical protein
VTDDGLMELAALKNLTTLRVNVYGKITPAGIAALQKELPKCNINSR